MPGHSPTSCQFVLQYIARMFHMLARPCTFSFSYETKILTLQVKGVELISFWVPLFVLASSVAKRGLCLPLIISFKSTNETLQFDN